MALDVAPFPHLPVTFSTHISLFMSCKQGIETFKSQEAQLCVGKGWGVTDLFAVPALPNDPTGSFGAGVALPHYLVEMRGSGYCTNIDLSLDMAYSWVGYVIMGEVLCFLKVVSRKELAVSGQYSQQLRK